MAKRNVGILGATGAVGQNYIRLLQQHPWFEITYLSASPQNKGKTYEEAVGSRWLEGDIPQHLRTMRMGDANVVEDAKCDIIFSAIDGTKDAIRNLETAYAKVGYPVISNNSAHRWTANVPMVIPEVNPQHLELVKKQGTKGFVVTKPNCSLQSYVVQLHALMQHGYVPDRVIVTTLQASSGAGYPGVPSLDLIDNVVPFIEGEDEKTQHEPLKIYGGIVDDEIVEHDGLKISACCTRVPVIHGHTAVVHVGFKDRVPVLEEVLSIWETFRGKPQEYDLPSAPKQPLLYRSEPNRPQPRRDRNADKGMAIVSGRLTHCDVLDFKFVGLSHNTVRGAAGGAILTAELLLQEKYM